MKRRLLGFTLILFFSRPALARVFTYNEMKFSTYLRGTIGLTNLQKTAYGPGFPASDTFPDSNGTNTAFSGEFGFAYAIKQSFNLRIGVELLYPAMTTGLSVKDSGGNVLGSVTSQVYSVIPQANLEIYLKKTPTARIYFGGGSGYAITTLKNTITLNSLGQSDYPAAGSGYIEEGTGWGIMGQAFTGFEIQIFDNVGFSLDAGYRYLIVNNYTSNRNYISPIGTFYTGNPLKNFDGSPRTTDLSGFFAAANFRIYIY